MKSRSRDEKFKMVMVRIPKGLDVELEAAAAELGLKPAQWIRMEMMKIFEARKLTHAGTVSVGDQSAIANS